MTSKGTGTGTGRGSDNFVLLFFSIILLLFCLPILSPFSLRFKFPFLIPLFFPFLLLVTGLLTVFEGIILTFEVTNVNSDSEFSSRSAGIVSYSSSVFTANTVKLAVLTGSVVEGVAVDDDENVFD